MRLAPRTLLGRHALLIVVLVALGQLGGAVLVRELLYKPRLEQIGDGLARTVSALRAGLTALPPQARAAFVEQFNARALHGARVAPAASPPSPQSLLPPLRWLERRLVQSVSRRIAADDADIVWRREAGGSLALRIAIDGTAYWVVLPGVMPVRELTGVLLAASLGGALLALAGALLIQRHLNRPLARLVRAARQLAQGTPPSPLPENGPVEIATVARSFNQLVQSLHHSDRERALMLAGISHDLRTPLTKLRLGVEILGSHEPALAAGMARSIEEMDAIVGQFLDFARDDASEAATPTDLAALAAQVAAAYADHAQPVQLDAQPTPVAPLRPQALRRALTNLVENAWRHGRPPVVLRTGVDAGAQQMWAEVADRGDGIAPEDAERLKQPFRRAEAARGGLVKGTGLGLAIAERAARAHGGRLALLPAEGGGLRARLMLPLP